MGGQFPKQQQPQPGKREPMEPKPQSISPQYKAADKLKGKMALITGGDSGIGRAVAVHFAREGADVAITYLNEHEDARDTQQEVERENRRCLTITGDVGNEDFCIKAVDYVLTTFGKLDILINNAGEQHACDDLTKVTSEQWERTFRTNIFAQYYITKAVLPHLQKGATIINSSSVTAYQGHPKLIDYASTKGAIIAFTRSMAINLSGRGIRVNAVAPGPIWTPLIPASFSEQKVESFGSGTAMERAGQPSEVAPCYVFLASSDSSYITGQTLHPNGGRIING
ncbi:MAG: glucose 1-dehydrogenase [Chitinivibrionales bacterium]|nr:glucose 1-dehydrogenase [Chitinivibrionales bacterium]